MNFKKIRLFFRDVRWELFLCKMTLKSLPMKIKGHWNKKVLLWWYRLWLRKDEFHKSLDLNFKAMVVMSPEEQEAYIEDLVKRRNIAHRRDFPEYNKEKP